MLTIARAKEITQDLLRSFGLKEAAFGVRWAGEDGFRLEIIVARYPAISVNIGADWTEESVKSDLLAEFRRVLNPN